MTTAVLDPTAVRQTSPRALRGVRHIGALAWRSLLKTYRTPEALIDVTIQPIIFLLLFVYVFGGAVSGSQHAYLQLVVPGILVQSLLFGSIAIGVNLNSDIEKGVFDRFRSLPIARFAPLAGGVLADVLRYVILSVFLFGTATIMGFRVGTNWFWALGGIAFGIAFALSLSWVGVWIGMKARSSGAVQGIAFLVMFPLTFGSNAYVPTDTLPGWLQAFVKVNPTSHLVDAIRGIMVGGPILTDVLISLAWMAGLLVVFVPLATRAYKRRV
jgi:oleandomycin transport system permease protein